MVTARWAGTERVASKQGVSVEAPLDAALGLDSQGDFLGARLDEFEMIPRARQHEVLGTAVRQASVAAFPSEGRLSRREFVKRD